MNELTTPHAGQIAPADNRSKPPSVILKRYLGVNILCRGSLREMLALSSAVVRFEDERRYTNLDRSEALRPVTDAAALLPSGEDLRAMQNTLTTALESTATQAEISSITAALCDAIPTFDPMKAPGYLDALLFVLETENSVEPFCPQALAGAVYTLIRSERFVPNPNTLLEVIRQETTRYAAWRHRVEVTFTSLAKLTEFRDEVAGALAERLTGERLRVDVETEAGMVSIVSDGQHLGKRHMEAAAMRPAHQPSNHSNRQSGPA